MAYIGTSPSNGVRRVHTYTATASQNIFTGASSEGVTLSYADTNYIDVFQNGVLLGNADYTSTSGTSVVLAQGASADDLIVIVVYDVFSVADTVSKTNGGSFDSAVTMSSTLDVTGASTLTGALSAKGGAVFNEDSADVDFRVESNGNANMLVVDGGNDRVGIGEGTPDVPLHITYTKDVAYSADNFTQEANVGLKIENTSSTANAMSVMQFRTGSGADLFFGIEQKTGNDGDFVFGQQNAPDKELMRINTNGELLIGSTNNTPAQSNVAGAFSYRPTAQLEISSNNTQCAFFNRTTDGTLIQFIQGGSSEGNIGISGSTVSYNGGHLSRYSRLTNDEQDTSIVKGTVMTNLDEMVVWSHEEVLWTNEDQLPDGVSVGDVKKSAYTEDNEQLNKMAVSSVEGDANVAGVFVNWDNDDDFNDMNVAMTGDMVIRIAQGTTVARGDLLMSAGDGTAKPQGDDIVRSKTIAKVTSTNVSHTYDDGTYLVPCVLMAC